MSSKGWMGVDFDGTLAHYTGWQGATHCGAPIPKMVERVKRWLAEGIEVRIFTARVWSPEGDITRGLEARDARRAIQDWCLEHIGQYLRVTCEKDYSMLVLYDDRAKQVEANTGRVVGDERKPHVEKPKRKKVTYEDRKESAEAFRSICRALSINILGYHLQDAEAVTLKSIIDAATETDASTA